MAHFTRTQPDSVWVTGYVPLSTDFIDLDNKTTRALSARGGTWSPTATITVDGANSPTALVIGNATQVVSGASLFCTATVPVTQGRLDANDYVFFAATYTRFIQVSFAAVPRSLGSDFMTYNAAAPSLFSSDTGTSYVGRIAVHHRATLASLQFSFQVNNGGTNPPEFLPSFSLIRVNRQGGIEPLHSVDAVTDAQGFQFFSPAPANSAAWAAGSVPQFFTYAPDQNHVVDTETFDYFYIVLDEYGADAVSGNQWFEATATLSNIVALYPG